MYWWISGWEPLHVALLVSRVLHRSLEVVSFSSLWLRRQPAMQSRKEVVIAVLMKWLRNPKSSNRGDGAI